MNIVICGAGEIGSHTAEVLADRSHHIVVVDLDADRLRFVGESMDVGTYVGNGAQANVLEEAGAATANLVVAATDSDEVNLLAASIAKSLGATKTIARVHHSAFFEMRGLDYQKELRIDRLICPEYSTALAIARTVRNPGAVAIENLARGQIEMQELVATKGTAVGKRLMDVRLPRGTRLALIRRQKEAFIPEARSVVAPGDSIILAGNADIFDDARRQFQHNRQPKKKVVIMGGPSMAVWLCRALHGRQFAIRLFERRRQRAEVLAEKLDWVTVINADPTDRNTFDEESLSQADLFVSLLESDEANIVASVLAKTRGVAEVMTVVQQSKYLDIIYDIGIDRAFSTRHVAGEEIDRLLDDRPLRHLGSLAEGSVDVFRVNVSSEANAVGKPLREINLSPDWVVAALQRSRDVRVPGAEDVIDKGDVLLVVGRHGREETLRKLLC